MSMELSVKQQFENFTLNLAFETSSRRIGILGSSGCGKSLTLKTIAGIHKVDAGRIVIDERVLFDSRKKIFVKPQKRSVGYLFQNYALFPNMTVQKNIAIGKKDGVDVTQMMERMGIGTLAGLYPHQISGGQQQRVALARMLASMPDTLLFDEPFSALDSNLKEKLRLELLNDLRDFEGNVIFVTHDRDEAYQFCDTLILLKDGRLVEMGETYAVFDKPKTLMAARLTGVKNISRIEKIGERTIIALDWNNTMLTVGEVLNDTIRYVGLRAHDIIPCGEARENCISTENACVTMLPFETYVILPNGIWWKTTRDMHVHNGNNPVPDFLYIKPESLMLLQEDT